MSHEEFYVAQGGAVKTKNHYYYCRQRATVAARQQCSKRRNQHCRLHSTRCIPCNLAAHSALCHVRQLLPAATAVLLCAALLQVLLCCCEMWTACWLWVVCWMCRVWRTYPNIKKGFPYKYEGSIGVGDRGKNRVGFPVSVYFSNRKIDK